MNPDLLAPDLPGVGLSAALSELEPVGLDELTATADLQTRQDRKYIVPLADLPGLVARAGAGCSVLTIDEQTRFSYRSTYFDTAARRAYFDAAHRRPSRFKVRIRNYADTELCVLEVKTRDRRGRTVKHRMQCDPVEESGLTAPGRAFVAGIAPTSDVAHALHPSLTTAYRRSTLLGGGGHPARVTIDTGLIWLDAAGRQRSLGRAALVETKTTGRPCSFDRLLWRAGHRPAPMSKYCSGLAALDPTLPANKWNRVLRRHLGWEPDRG